jgi:hypothetical protein
MNDLPILRPHEEEHYSPDSLLEQFLFNQGDKLLEMQFR